LGHKDSIKCETARSIAIDALPLLFEGGISNYTRPLVENLLEYAGSCWRVDLFFRMGISKARVREYQRYKEISELENCSHHLIWLPDRLLMGLWEHGIFLPFMLNRKGDIFIATTELVPKRNNANVGWIVHDIMQLRIPQFFPSNRDSFFSSVAKKLSRTDFVIAVSECTKRDIHELMQYPEERICVIYPGVLQQKTTLPVGKSIPFPERPYILYLGALALNKNVDGMLRIFSLCVHEHQLDMDIILTGRDFCGRSFWQSLIHDLKIERRVHITGWISDNDREYLLSKASMVWQFSWYEGFGLPVLEAASRGIPVLYTNRGAVPEILKNPEQEIDPADEEAAASKAAQALRSQEALERWKRLEMARASEFSWKKSAQKLLGWMEERL
jgi:glycosyltransferase involved in cell wall biosynthesis